MIVFKWTYIFSILQPEWTNAKTTCIYPTLSADQKINLWSYSNITALMNPSEIPLNHVPGVHRAHVIDENTPQSYRHRMPPERRTPEVYGRATLFNSRSPQQQQQQQQQQLLQQQQQLRPYEDMFNANQRSQADLSKDKLIDPQQPQQQQHRHFQQQSKFAQQQQFQPQNQPPQQYPGQHDYPHYPPHHHHHPDQPRFYDQQQQAVLNNSRQFQQQQYLQQHQQQQPHQHPYQPQQEQLNMRQPPAPGVRERIPRPHSADFLEYERQFGANPDQSPGPDGSGVPYRGQSRHPNRQQQPPRPKSSIEQRIPAELRRQMVEQQNIEDGFHRKSSTTPTPTPTMPSTSARNNNVLIAQQLLQNLQMDPSARSVNNFTPNGPRTPSLPRHPDTSTPNYRERPPQKINYDVSFIFLR